VRARAASPPRGPAPPDAQARRDCARRRAGTL